MQPVIAPARRPIEPVNKFMRERVADYIADFFEEKGITDVFSVVGGGAMYLNDALGHRKNIQVTYNHNEQASAMAAEAYARMDNRIAAVCVTTGPGATNAVTGVVCGWMDSIPMLIISGQARYATTVYDSGLPLRTRGVQEYDVIEIARHMTKYAELVKDPRDIRRCLEKAFAIAHEGRPGPCWLDIPLDVQGAMIETEELEGFSPEASLFDQALYSYANIFQADSEKKNYVPGEEDGFYGLVRGEFKDERVCDGIELADFILDKINKAERPVLFAGNGVRLAGAHKDFLELVDNLKIPVVDGMSSVDAIATDSPYYAGRCGTTGTRAGNFAMQNSDLFLSIGGRLGFFQTGFNYSTWARCAYKIVSDVDESELKKDSIKADLRVTGDAKALITMLNRRIRERREELKAAAGKNSRNASGAKFTRGDSEKDEKQEYRTLAETEFPAEKKAWTSQCRTWVEKYPVLVQHMKDDPQPNIYDFYDHLTRRLDENSTLLVSCGTSRVAGSQAAHIKEGMRFITNPNTASMGYDLPPAIGLYRARPERTLVLVTGEGSLQMNIQEFQTIVQNKIPVKIFIMNNGGYHSIRMTQTNYFQPPLVGVGEESGDLSFPDLSKLMPAYGIDYLRVEKHEDMDRGIDWTLAHDGPCLCEMMLSTKQVTEPKAASRKLENGQMVSAPLEDMAPFLSREELAANMYIPLIEEEKMRG